MLLENLPDDSNLIKNQKRKTKFWIVKLISDFLFQSEISEIWI